MRVLFAVSNDNVSASIIRKYQEKYKEIINSKNVYYFNAIIKELQKDKNYDAIVIGEDLEPISNNNYDTIDKFLFEKLDSISDESYKSNGDDIPIILICSDRRTKSDQLLVKLFGIGIYNALIGNDRNIETLCNLINKPRGKKEAKNYYKIDSEDVNYKPENEEEVSETEIQNILAYYKKIGNNDKKCIESFESIASQYNNTQLRIIIRFLPPYVKTILEQGSVSYQKLMNNGTVLSNGKYNKYDTNKSNKEIDFFTKDLEKTKMTKPVVIPSAMSVENTNANNMANIANNNNIPQNNNINHNMMLNNNVANNMQTLNNNITPKNDLGLVENIMENSNVQPNNIEAPKRRGRPKKINIDSEPIEENKEKRGRGRPKKVQEETILQENLQELNNIVDTLQGNNEILPQENANINNNNQNTQPIANDYLDLFGMVDNTESLNVENTQNNIYGQTFANTEELIKNDNNKEVITNFIAKNSKIVAFVGTSKNGTSFIVNNLAQLLSQKGVKTAILDLTKNRNSYYMFTDNDQMLMQVATNSIKNLTRGIAQGINVTNNLTVYTALPGDEIDIQDMSYVLKTLDDSYSAILIDCDFETDINCFKSATEIYLVQSMDALTIQPLTLFLSELKMKNILDENKLRVIINMEIKSKILTDKMILGGMAKYNEPSMTLQRDLFNPNTIKYMTIPFEEQTYARYIDAIAMCKISLSGYSQVFMNKLEQLSNMVYPLISGGMNNTNYNRYSNDTGKQKKGFFGGKKQKQDDTQFSSGVNGTLDKMRAKY